MTESNDSTRAAGEGLTDKEMVEQVAAQTSGDLKVEDVFKREQAGAVTSSAIADATADEVGEQKS